MRTFKHLLAVAALLAGGVYTANAQVMIETDLTSQFNSLATSSWTGSSGQVGWAAPKVTTNSGLNVAAWESYCGDWNGGCTNTGTIMKTTVSGLTAGTYKIELYGAAAFTFNRGFGSEAFTGESTVGGKATSDTYTAGQSIDTETGVYLYATTSEGTYSQEIPIWYADNFNGSGLSTAVLNGVVVGANGEIEIGMSKTSKSTNWHVVQLKGVTATVDAAATFAYYKSEAEALYDSPMNASLLQDLKNAAGVDLSEADAELYKTSIETLAKLVSDAKASIDTYAVAKEILDAANGYDKDGQDSYVADETISALLAAYNGGTLEEVTAEQKTAAKAALATACKAQTQPADGCDMTAFIINSDFDSGNTDGWTKETPYGGNCAIQGGSRMEYWAGNASNRALASFNIYQKLTGLPSGAYTITAEMYNSLNDEGGNYTEFSPTCGIYGVSSNEKVALVTEEGTTLKPYTTEEVLVINGELIIGAKNTVTPMAARWFLFDNVKLTYAHQLSADDMIAIATEQYREVLAAAQAVDLTTKMNATTKSDFETALDTYAEDKVVTPGATVASIQEAIDELNNQVAAVEASVNTYAATAQALETYSAKAAALDADGQAAFDVAAIQTAYDNGTMVDDMTADVAVAFRRAVKAQTTPGADMTGAIINPSFEEAGGNGWTATGVNNIHGGAANNYCAESYRANFTLSQIVEGMPNGIYQLTAQGFYRQDGSDNEHLPVFYANGKTGTFPEKTGTENSMSGASGSFSNGLYTIEPIKFTVVDGTITLGAKLEGNTNLWCIWDNFTLTFVAPFPITLDEEDDNTAKLEELDGCKADITLTRTLQTGSYNTFAVPFATAIPEGWTVKELTASEFNNATGLLSLTFGDALSIEAGKPYLVKVGDENVVNPTFNDVTIVDGTTMTQTTAVDFIPTLGKTLVTGPTGNESNAEAVLFLGANNTLLNPTVVNDPEQESSYMKGFRAYFQLKGEATQARAFSIDFGDGETTGIKAIDNGKLAIDNVVYDLQGRKVQNAAAKGMYIVNGKKVIIK